MAVCNVQRAISIPEPTNEPDSLWRTAQALKETVEVMQGVRGNREYALKCELEDTTTIVNNITGGFIPGITSLVDLIDTDIVPQAQYDMFYNDDGNMWKDTAGALQWNPTLGHLQLANALSINWLNSASTTVKLLEFTATGGDPLVQDVLFQADWEGANLATTYTEESQYLEAATFFGNTQLSTTSPIFNTSSLLTTGAATVSERVTFLVDTPALWSGTGKFLTCEISFRFTTYHTSGTKYPLIVGDTDFTFLAMGAYVSSGNYSIRAGFNNSGGLISVPTLVAGTDYSCVIESDYTAGAGNGVERVWFGPISGGTLPLVSTVSNLTAKATNFTPTITVGNQGAGTFGMDGVIDHIRVTASSTGRYGTGASVTMEDPFAAIADPVIPEGFHVGDQIYPTRIDGTLVGLENNIGINWENTVAADVELLTLSTSGAAGRAMDFYQNAATLHSTTTSATYVDVVNGAQISQAAMTVGDDYLVFHQGVIHGLGSVGAYRLLASGAVLAGSTTTFTGVQTATADPDGHPYGYAGWFTADDGADFKAQHHRQTGTSTTEALSQSFLLNLTTDCPNHIKDQSVTTTNVGVPPFTLTDCAVVLPAGDWLLFVSTRIDFPTNAGYPEVGINDGTNDIPLMGRMRVQAGNQLNSGAMFYLDGYAGGTVTVIASSSFFSLDIDYKCIVAIPLSDFSEAYAVQDATTVEVNMSAGRNVDEIITTLSVPSIAGTSSDWFAFGFGSHSWNGSDPSIGFEILSNVNAGGDTKIGWDNGRNHRISTTSGTEAREGQPIMSDSTLSLTAGDSVDIKLNAVCTETTFASHQYSNEGAALILLATPDTQQEIFIAGDPAYPTVIDGLTTNITSPATDIDGTLNVDGAVTLSSTLDGRDVALDGTNQDAHLALTNEHLDWTAVSVGTIDPTNYVDNDTADHTLLSNIGVNAHSVIDTHIADLTIHFTKGIATTGELVDIGHAINTSAAKTAGYQVFNTTTGAPVWAVDDTDGGVWNNATGAAAHTPLLAALGGSLVFTGGVALGGDIYMAALGGSLTFTGGTANPTVGTPAVAGALTFTGGVATL